MIIESIAVIAIVTYLIRIGPFLLFGKKKETPKILMYFGDYLPPAVMGMLIIFSIKDINFLNTQDLIPIILCILVTIAVHIYKRNNLLSILTGTILYMLLIQNVFI